MRHFILSVCISTEMCANIEDYIGILVAREIRLVSIAFSFSLSSCAPLSACYLSQHIFWDLVLYSHASSAHSLVGANTTYVTWPSSGYTIDIARGLHRAGGATDGRPS